MSVNSAHIYYIGQTAIDLRKVSYWGPANEPGYVLVRLYDSATPVLVEQTAYEAAKQASDNLDEAPSNIVSKFREAFETYVPNGTRWTEVKGSGDIVRLGGNTAGCSYLIISKDPLTAGTTTTITSVPNFDFPVDFSVGLHRSQAVLGVEFACELVDNGTPLAVPADLAISAIQQATTTLTVTTTLPHGLVPGKRIQIYGVPDSRFNYPALVVATIPAPNQFTCTAGPMGNIPSVTAGPFAAGFVSYRLALGGAQNGTSMIFESASATEASFYIRSEAGDSQMSGTLGGKHPITVATTASVVALSSPFVYSFQPTNEYRLAAQADKIQWTDVLVDSLTAATPRHTRTQVVPSIDATYALRFRATTAKDQTVPVAKIVSISKSGSTTWTVTTDVAHNLTTSSLVVIYGNRDTTNFANVTAATAVTLVVDATNFQIVSTTGTAVGYGGTVYEVQGGNLPSALGIATMVGSTVARTAGIVTAVVSASFSGALIGDYINLHGWRADGTGADLGVDGPYRIQNISTTTLTLEPIGSTATSPDIGTTNCGGAIIKRTDLRISFVRVFDYERLRVETLPRPTGDLASAMPVVLMGGTTAVTGTVTATVTGYPTAASAADAYANPTITHIGADNMTFNGTTWDRWRSSSNASDALATVTTGNANAAAFGLFFNGTSWDRARNNWNVATGDTGAKTTTGTGATQTNYDAVGAVVTIIMGAVSGTTPTFVGKLQMSQDSGTTWVDIPGAATASITASGNYTLTCYPGATVVANASVSLPLPRTWRLAWTIGGTTPSFTITSVQVSYIRG